MRDQLRNTTLLLPVFHPGALCGSWALCMSLGKQPAQNRARFWLPHEVMDSQIGIVGAAWEHPARAAASVGKVSRSWRLVGGGGCVYTKSID